MVQGRKQRVTDMEAELMASGIISNLELILSYKESAQKALIEAKYARTNLDLMSKHWNSRETEILLSCKRRRRKKNLDPV